jgi:Domain of unknown function (DUF4262)
MDVDAYLETVREGITRHGWMLQAVFPTDAGDGPPFVYTVGLAALGHPELIVYGLPHDTGGVILNELGRRVRDGRRLAHGERLDDVVEGFQVEVLAVADNQPLGVARRLYGPGVRALQIVYPDAGNLWPWEEGCDRVVASLPLLGRRAGW